MNIHHLELFYYVARHGGISAAVRQMPYGIQQPAVSAQILLLEEDLGVKLFVRQPFRLTAEGQELLAFVRPFFDNLDAVGVRLRRRPAPQLRIGASETVLRGHLPVVIQRVRQGHPDLRLGLRSGFQPEIETWLENREIELALIPLRGKPPARTRCLRLVRLPLVLLVHRKTRFKSAAEVWARGTPAQPLIGLPLTESISLLFQKGLRRLGVAWPLAIEASSMELITQYVANGEGIGVNIGMPAVVRHPDVRVLPLDGFEPVELVALWHGEPTPLLRAVLEEIQRYVGESWPEAASADRLAAAR
ncbi:MAG: LysR family transcriptional regulator [Verrucomicrobia bacterium]|nr:LysR family transcriptional regulator [Verrucomicrobiota bacterium]